MRLIDADELVNRIIGDPAVKYGEWIEDAYGYFHCSECGFEFDEPENVTPFCQSCGARMEGGENDS